MFSLEIYGRDGKLSIDGLGGSYGTEKVTYYQMLPQMGPPETTSWEFPGADDSWALETDRLREDIRLGAAHPRACRKASARSRSSKPSTASSGYPTS
jgi:hypothetical protein